jgi:type II secretory pathway pseudopilin PulG
MTELLVVIVIAVIIAAITIPTIAGMMRSTRLTSGANSAAGMLRSARSMAVASMEYHYCVFNSVTDPSGEDVAVMSVFGRDLKLRSETELPRGLTVTPSFAGRLEFHPDGSARLKGEDEPRASYDVVVENSGNRRRTVHVKGLTGLVTITETE